MTTILTAENLPMEMRKYDFNVVLIDLDEMIGESIMQNSDDSYTIILNSKWSAEMQKRCFCHALDHIRNNDWEKNDVNQIEKERHDESGALC
jgi:hypothetical protein